MSYHRLAIAVTSTSIDIAKNIVEILQPRYDYPIIAKMDVKTFADGEISVRYLDNIRGADLYIIGSICPPNVNNALMELLLAVDAAQRASAYHVTAVVPYYGYARQDRKASSRTPISAKMVADLLVTAGIDRIVVQDIHATQIQGFFPARVPFDAINGEFVFVQDLVKRFDKSGCANLVVVSPDAGGAARCRKLSSLLQAELAIVDKRRLVANQCDVMNVIGNVEGKICLLYDDIVDTARSLTKAAAALKGKGATEIYACASHAVLSEDACSRIADSSIDFVMFSDSIQISEDKRSILGDKLIVVSSDFMFATSIECIHKDASLGEALDKIQSEVAAVIEVGIGTYEKRGGWICRERSIVVERKTYKEDVCNGSMTAVQSEMDKRRKASDS